MTPRQGVRLVLAVVFAVLVLVAAVAAVRPIIGYFQQKAADAKAHEEHAVDDSVGRGLEAGGTANLARSESSDARQMIIIRENAHALEIETRADPTAADRLPDSVIDRVSRGDLVLCGSGVECRTDLGAAAPVDP